MEVWLYILYFAVLASMPIIGCIYDAFNKPKRVMFTPLCSDEEICRSLNEELEGLTDKEWQMLKVKRTEEKKGTWKYIERKEPQYDIAGVRTWAVVYKCSECGFLHTVIENSGIYDFCPNCGAEMSNLK